MRVLHVGPFEFFHKCTRVPGSVTTMRVQVEVMLPNKKGLPHECLYVFFCETNIPYFFSNNNISIHMKKT